MSKSKKVGKSRMGMIVLFLFVCIAVAACMILPPSVGRTKPFTDENGDLLPGSISEKVFMEINGTSLGMYIMAKDETKPVLLFLAGGPGIPEYFLEQEYPSGLEDEFVVCYLEYRGTSLSYQPKTPRETMTTQQYIDDVVATTNYLCERFGQEKVYLMAHSFGTYIGIQTAYQYPELYHAYIAMSQITDQKQSELLAYSYMYEQYQKVNNTKMIKKFARYPIHTDETAYKEYSVSSLRDTAMHELGVGTTHNMDSVITGIFFPSLRQTVYTPMERINIWRGKAFAQTTPVHFEVLQYNAFTEHPKIDLPIYFFAGIYDYTCCYSLQKEYYMQIQAPLKAFYTFDHSAHSPLFEESAKAKEILLNDVLNGNRSLSD